MSLDRPQPRSGVRPRPVLLRRVRDLARAGAWRELCDLLLSEDPPSPAPAVVAHAIEAALIVGDEALRGWAVGKALESKLPHQLRAASALKLVRGGHLDEGWAVLRADEATVKSLEGRGLVLTTLLSIVQNSATRPERRREARIFHDQVRTLAETSAQPSDFSFPASHVLAPPTYAIDLRLAPTADRTALSAIASMLDTNERTLRVGHAPAVRVFHDVAINRFGEVWRAGTQAVDATASTVAAGVDCTGAANNLYHWLGAWLPSLAWRFAPDAPAGLPFLLRDDARHYQLESLELLGGPEVPVVRVGNACRVGELYKVEHRRIRLDPNSGIEPMVTRLTAAAERRAPVPPVQARLLYISRRDAAARRMANEVELEARLEALGFTSVQLTPYSLSEGIALIRAAECVVAPHGAGLSYLLFARPGTMVFELMPFNEKVLQVRLCMARLSRQRGHRHLLWVERPEDKSGSWSASIPEVVAALKDFLR